MKSRASLTAITASLILAACGGGGGDPDRPFGNVEGYAADGIILAGNIAIYSMNPQGEKDVQLGSGTTDDEGHYSIGIQAPTQPVIIEVTGGHYIEEASGADIALEDGQRLRGIALYESGKPFSIMVTPLTHIATGLAQYKISQGTDAATAVQQALAEVSALYGLDIARTRPRDITDPANATGTLTSEHRYGFLLAGISHWTQWASERYGVAPHTNNWTSIALAQILYDDIRVDGLLDGRGPNPNGSGTLPLGFGNETLDQGVYRTQFAEHTLAVARSARNQTGVTVHNGELQTTARALAGSTHNLFGGVPAGNSLDERPFGINSLSNGQFYSGTFTFKAEIDDIVGADQVSFYLDDTQFLGNAADPLNPSIEINTNDWSDGRHIINVDARNVFGKIWEGVFYVTFDNTLPGIQITSQTITNKKNFTVTGTYEEGGAGLQSLTVNGVGAVLVNGAWHASITLDEGKNEVALVALDGVGNSASKSIYIEVDTTAPTITNGPHGDAAFENGAGNCATVQTRPLDDENESTPMCVITNHLSLAGIAIERAALEGAAFPFFAFTAADPDVNGVFTETNDLIVRKKYKKNGLVVSTVTWGTPESEYLVPLSTGTLDTSWHNSTPSDKQSVLIEVEDRAGNISSKEFTFKAAFHVPAFTPEVVELGHDSTFEQKAATFADRQNLYGTGFAAVSYTFTNPSSKGVYIYPDDGSASHTVAHSYEEGVRENFVEDIIETQWRYALMNPVAGGCPSATFGDPLDIGAPLPLKNWNGAAWESVPQPPAALGDRPQDHLPSAVKVDTNGNRYLEQDTMLNDSYLSGWENIADDVRNNKTVAAGGTTYTYEYDYVLNTANPIPNAAVIANMVITPSGPCSPQSFVQKRQVYTLKSKAGYPKNTVLTPPATSVPFSTSHFVVMNTTAGAEIPSTGGYYLVPAGHTVVITKWVTTPASGVMPYYNYTQVANWGSVVNNYSRPKYDKRIEWSIAKGLSIAVTHDAGSFSQINQMPELEINAATGTAKYSISR